MLLLGFDLILLGLGYFIYREIVSTENDTNDENLPSYSEIQYDTPPLYS